MEGGPLLYGCSNIIGEPIKFPFVPLLIWDNLFGLDDGSTSSIPSKEKKI